MSQEETSHKSEFENLSGTSFVTISDDDGTIHVVRPDLILGFEINGPDANGGRRNGESDLRIIFRIPAIPVQNDSGKLSNILHLTTENPRTYVQLIEEWERANRFFKTWGEHSDEEEDES